ncbi:FAD-binding domain-containing protein, partial [Candidatus Woesearchaeota archaeon]|nr:FAD-binding domain-containing protein [Candidatus Woesearchaeota archaeon]
GTISIREIYSSFKENFQEVLINEVYWRDFFTHIIYHFPNVLDGAFKNKYDKIKWDNDKKLFQKWCEGKTGFPIVDAGMRELNTTGYMHNRVRMIVASFLVKDLHINWQWGEKYFAQNLIDYDPAVNNGNWQWAASTGCDAQPYFRIFNPWSQQEKFDRDCEYIKKWVPELKDLTSYEIHNLYKNHNLKNYPKPIVEHKEESQKAKEMFKRA